MNSQSFWNQVDPDSEKGRFLGELIQSAQRNSGQMGETEDWEVRKQLAFVEINNIIDRISDVPG